MNEQYRELQERLEQERTARADAERIVRQKDDFLAMLGHELRTPLNSILGWARLLEIGRLSPEEAQRGAHTIARNARALSQIVNDLLDLSGVASGKIRLDAEETDLCEIIEAAFETTQNAADTKGITLEKHVESESCLVFGDPHRLQQVMWNLLSNAVKFTPPGGRVDVILRSSDGNHEIAVSDTGVGIPREFLPFVFDRFRQAAASSERSFTTGLGLGLAIVKQLVELHGGSVTATSEGPGRGSTFTVTLPRVAPREDYTGIRPSPFDAQPVRDMPFDGGAHRADLQNLRVLVVDDEPDTLELLRRVLGESHAEVAAAASVKQALVMIKRFAPHVLVSDLSMPGRDGFELIRTLRLTMGPDELPAAALTAFARPEDAVRAHEAGFQMHVVKPVEPDELVRIVAHLAGRV